MEIGKIILFNNKKYKIEKVLCRTKGGRNQQIGHNINTNIEHRRKFYIVSNNGNLFWVKVYVDKKLGHSIEYEFNETQRLNKQFFIGKNSISVVNVISMTDDMILMEYLDKYSKLIDIINDKNRSMIKNLLSTFIRFNDIHDYDLSYNTMLY